jgi:phosphatidylserine synthase
MTRRGFHILLALILVVCALCPYAEFALNWNQSIFDTGYDGESTVAAIALLLILAFIIANLLAHFISDRAAAESLVNSPITLRTALDFTSTVCEVSPPPLSLRI